MNCNHCKTENPEEANYCRECGKIIELPDDKISLPDSKEETESPTIVSETDSKTEELSGCSLVIILIFITIILFIVIVLFNS